MSFRQNGRYGHVPPAQYGAPPVQNLGSGLRRQSSFDNGDDSSYFESGGDAIQRSVSNSSMEPPYPTSGQDELFLGGAPPPPPPRPSYGPTSPALSGYQHQYQPQSAAVSPGTYNPQQFARTYSTTQPTNSYNPSSYGSQQQYGSHTPYVPAAYQHAALQRQQTMPSYGYGQSPPLPQSSYGQSPQQTQQAPPPQRAYSVQQQHTQYNPSFQHSPFVPSAHAPLPSNPSPYRTPPPLVTTSIPYPTNGDNHAGNSFRSTSPGQSYQSHASMPIAPYHSYDETHTYSNRISRPSSSSNVSYENSTSHDSIASLQRHPTGRRLPPAPLGRDGPPDDQIDEEWDGQDRTAEEQAQEQIYQEIEAAILNNASHATSNGDLLDGELGDLGYDPRETAINPTGSERMHADHNYDYDDDSDPEAASGLEAMRLAEQEEIRLGGGSFGISTFSPSLSQQSPASPPKPSREPSREDFQESSDSDYANIDMGLYGGGYDAHMSYGDNLTATADHPGEAEDQSRPLPMPHELNRNSTGHEPAAGLGGMTDFAMPGDTAMHPFPPFEPARVDTYGTGGLQRPTSHRQRLSFDEGDESIRFSESRNSAYSDSESPGREDIPDMFYHPAMNANIPANLRPLPAVPNIYNNPVPNLQPSVSHRQSSYQTSYPPDGPEAYSVQQELLSPNAPFVPRSASLSSHSSTPQVIPPTRSRTDAEERQARQRALKQQQGLASSYDGFDAAGPLSAVPIDPITLPLGRRRKISPASLKYQDFRRCIEPWALSCVASWLREMCGGETGDGESDLKPKVIADCLVALFTHKVPTMNTADAEVLSDRLVADMLEARVLVSDEEWVKFGAGSISGVLWQMTGSGCYAPMLHEHEIRGRCYSHHCGRTLKKLNLSLEELQPAKKTEDWATFFAVTKETITTTSSKELHRQNALHEIVMSEDKYMDNLNVLRVLYRDQLQAWQPPIIAPAKLPKFMQQVFGKAEAVKLANQEHLLAQLKYRQQEQGPWIQGFSDIFREWVRKARQVYLDYAAGYAHAVYLVRREAEKNIFFSQFLDQARDNKMSNRLDWNTFLFAPLKRLQQYPLMLREVLKCSLIENEEKANLLTAIDEISNVTMECDRKVDEMANKVNMLELSNKLYLRPGMERVELNLDHLGRELIFQGDLQRAGNNRFTWLETHAILFDHYLVLAKVVPQRDGPGGSKKEIYDVSKLPIPMQLLVLESTNDEAAMKSKGLAVTTTVRGGSETRAGRSATINDRPTGALEHTNTNSSVSSQSALTKTITANNSENDAKLMFPFRVRHLGKSEIYTLYAPTAQNRAAWCEKILEAKEKHAASLFAQNAEPFKLSVMADSAFAYDAAGAASKGTSVAVRGTPLDRAIRHMEKEYGPVRPGPVCRASVNCATTFSCFGKTMVAVGTDYGVYTSEACSPRGWTRSIQIARVSQITILEEFSLCLIIADKALIAYHLDAIVPPTSTGAYQAPPLESSARRAPQKLSGTRDVGFFATGRMKDRTLVFYKKREGLSSTFKVLEPVFQKSSEKRSKLFGRKPFANGSSTEFFREFDEFYIPSECFGINLFHTYIAVSTPRGFELLTLDRKQTSSIPDLRQQAIATIASRLNGQKPLGMFRLSDAEFLLCYEECGVYISKHGEVSRSVVLEFVGKATSATLFGAYLVLFDNDFIEVRNAENGRLRQIIAGKDVRCLDYGVPIESGKAGEKQDKERNLKIAMSHPEIAGCQLILELSLNSGITG